MCTGASSDGHTAPFLTVPRISIRVATPQKSTQARLEVLQRPVLLLEAGVVAVFGELEGTSQHRGRHPSFSLEVCFGLDVDIVAVCERDFNALVAVGVGVCYWE